MKKTLALALALLLAAGALASCSKDTNGDADLSDFLEETVVITEETIDGDTFTFEEIDSETVKITDFRGATKAHKITIPEKLNGKFVTEIAKEAFANNSNISEIDFSKATKLHAIGEYAFRGCTSLLTLALPSTLETLSEGAFYGCTNLAEVDFAQSKIPTISKNAFMECISLTAVTVPGTVKTVGDAAFFGCSKLETLTVSEGVEKIGVGAFQKCSELASVTLPESIAEKTDIGKYAFSNTPKLYAEGVTCPAGSAAAEYIADLQLESAPKN